MNMNMNSSYFCHLLRCIVVPSGHTQYFSGGCHVKLIEATQYHDWKVTKKNLCLFNHLSECSYLCCESKHEGDTYWTNLVSCIHSVLEMAPTSTLILGMHDIKSIYYPPANENFFITINR